MTTAPFDTGVRDEGCPFEDEAIRYIYCASQIGRNQRRMVGDIWRSGVLPLLDMGPALPTPRRVRWILEKPGLWHVTYINSHLQLSARSWEWAALRSALDVKKARLLLEYKASKREAAWHGSRGMAPVSPDCSSYNLKPNW